MPLFPRRALPVLIVLGLAAPVLAQAVPQAGPMSADVFASFRAATERRLDAIAASLDGAMGYCIVDPATGERFARLGYQAFPTASSIKVAILYELFKQAEEGRVDLKAARPLPASARVGGSGVLAGLEAPSLPLIDYAGLMIQLSDNTATNLLIDTLGMERVNARMRALGLPRIWLQRRMIDLDAAKAGRENLASPCDLAGAFLAVHEGKGLTTASRDAMIAILEREKATALTRALPPGVRVASKPGGLDGVATDAGIVYLEGHPFVIAVMTTWLKDGAEGERAIESATRTAYEYFSRRAISSEYGRALK